MKGVPGLLLALGLGIAGAFCNWIYLAQKGEELERIDFIGIDEGTKINVGDKFVEAHFRKIPVPRNAAGHLEKAALTWGEMQSVVGMAATKSFSPGEILLRQYVKTPPENDIKKLLAQDERVLWIPVDTRTFVSSLVSAGDQVSFIVPRLVSGVPAPAGTESGGGGDGAVSGTSSATEMIGPFRILALGNRLGSREVLSAAGGSASQENVMAVAVKVIGNSLDARGQQISDLLRLTNFQQVQVLLHPAADTKPKATK
jgi:hypothetical protein